MLPHIIYGDHYTDHRGELQFNNSFNMSQVKRFYCLKFKEKITRRWQGHKIEQRWFTAVSGSFNIELILVDDWIKPSVNLAKINFEISNESLDVLHIPAGYITSIEALYENSNLLVMSNYAFNEIKDEYKFPSDYFKI